MFILRLLENSPQDIITVCSCCCNMITHCVCVFFSLSGNHLSRLQKRKSFFFVYRKTLVFRRRHLTAAFRLFSRCCIRRARVGCLFYLHVFITSTCTNIHTRQRKPFQICFATPKMFESTSDMLPVPHPDTHTRTHICQWLYYNIFRTINTLL